MTKTSFAILMLVLHCRGNPMEIQPDSLSKRATDTLPTFISFNTWTNMECGGIPYLREGASYLFGSYPFPIQFEKFLNTVYEKMSNEKMSVKDKLIQSLNEGAKTSDAGYKYEKAASALGNHYQTDGLEKAVVYVYTTYYIYKDLSSALRKQGTSIALTDTERSLSSFALVFNAILFNWTPLQSVSQITYRGSSLDDTDIAKYSVGTEFVWIPFTSSSTNRTVSEDYYMGNVLFVFDNSKLSNWRPKDIRYFSYDPSHQEALYPSGATFRVTSVQSYIYKGKSVFAISATLQNPAIKTCVSSATERLFNNKFRLIILCLCIAINLFCNF